MHIIMKKVPQIIRKKGQTMIKDSSICFRASKEMRASLLQISKEDRRSLSSTIANILSDYLKKRKGASATDKSEKRQYPREALSVPAVINQPETSQMGIAAITEISLGGLKILLPRELEERLAIEAQGSRFEVVFNLPSNNKPIRLSCESRNVADIEDDFQVGATFVDADFENYKSLQAYLI